MNVSVKSAWPSTVVVMGGGRWARVYIDVLLELLPVNCRIIVYTPRNSAAMVDWIIGKKAGSRVIVSNSLPVFHEQESKVVIVVNAVADHEKSMAWAISQGAAVLVEKPLTLSSSVASRLINQAEQRGIYLAAAHVFLFTEYCEIFKNSIQMLDKISSIDVVWEDAALEVRHGEVKSFDPGVRIFEDCLPHVLSILEMLNPGEYPRLVRTELLRGGAQLDIVLSSAHCRYKFRLVRNGTTRRRVITVRGKDEFFTLDFSQEPATIMNRSGKVYPPLDWTATQKPLSCMLEAFLDAASGGSRDLRLATVVGLRAVRLSELIFPLYHTAQTKWLAKMLLEVGENDKDVRYALREVALLGARTPFQQVSAN